jgi:hypothetical protein
LHGYPVALCGTLLQQLYMYVNDVWIKIERIINLECLLFECGMNQYRLLPDPLWCKRLQVSNIVRVWEFAGVVERQHRTAYIQCLIVLHAQTTNQ